MPTRIPAKSDVEGWDIETTLKYGREGLQTYSDDRQELLNRRNVLITSQFADRGSVLREVVMLSVAAKDMATTSKVVGWLEEAGDPAMGYHVYKRLERESEPSLPEDLLISAARNGHFPAKRTLIVRRAKEKGGISRILLPLALCSHALKVFRIARKDLNDLRLK